jgi:hypothetical protein
MSQAQEGGASNMHMKNIYMLSHTSCHVGHHEDPEWPGVLWLGLRWTWRGVSFSNGASKADMDNKHARRSNASTIIRTTNLLLFNLRIFKVIKVSEPLLCTCGFTC